MKLSEYDKIIGTYKMYISDFDIGELRSGHFRDLPIIVNGQKLNSLFYASYWAYVNRIASGKVFIDTPSEIFSRWPL